MMFGHLSNAEVDELLLKDECYLGDKDRVYERWDEVSDCSDDDEDYIDAGFVAQQGIIELLENDFERLLQAGLARIHFNSMKEDILEELEDEGIEIEPRDRITGRDENVVKVDFGTKQ